MHCIVIYCEIYANFLRARKFTQLKCLRKMQYILVIMSTNELNFSRKSLCKFVIYNLIYSYCTCVRLEIPSKEISEVYKCTASVSNSWRSALQNESYRNVFNAFFGKDFILWYFFILELHIYYSSISCSVYGWQYLLINIINRHLKYAKFTSLILAL